MSNATRPVIQNDIGTIIDLAEADLRARQVLDRLLWRRHREAAARLRQSIESACAQPDGPIEIAELRTGQSVDAQSVRIGQALTIFERLTIRGMGAAEARMHAA